MIRVGSLFSGYLGLDLAVHQVLGECELVWVCDNDRGAKKILEHRAPGIPNLGDITKVNWADVPPVDVITGGFPCTDTSLAGRRAGLGPATRSGLWAHMADAINQLRPQLVVAENVRGLASADGHGDVEPCPWCMGTAGDGEPPLRALGAVLADLADLWYDTAWHGLPASDVGAPHQRFRIVIVAWPTAHPDSQGRTGWTGEPRQGRWDEPSDSAPANPGRAARGTVGHAVHSDSDETDGTGRAPEPGGCGCAAAHPGRDARPENDPDIHPVAGRGGSTVPDTSGHGRDEGWPAPARVQRGPDVAVGGDRSPADPDSDAVRDEPVPVPGCCGETVPGDPGPAAADTDSDGFPWCAERDNDPRTGFDSVQRDDVDGLGVAAVEWGIYGPAIRRWETVLGRTAPAPAKVGTRGQPKLNPVFVEWMMGLPSGWVTDVPGISDNEALHALGNGVVPQQVIAGLRVLLPTVVQELA